MQTKILTVLSKLFSFAFTLRHPLLSRGELMIMRIPVQNPAENCA